MEDKKYKCESCGANLKKDAKQCEYCGSVNKNYEEKAKKELELPEIKIGDIIDEALNDLPFGGFIRTTFKKK